MGKSEVVGQIVFGNNADTLFQSPAQSSGVSSAMKHGIHSDKIRFDVEKHAVFCEFFNWRSSYDSACERELLRIFQNASNGGLNFVRESVSQSGLMVIIPFDCVLEFGPRFNIENYLAAHFRFLSLCESSERTCSHGIPLFGSLLKRAARRSNSSICSDDNRSSKSPNSSTICPATFRRSFSGRRRICSRISIALINGSLIEPRPSCKFAA
jgi:hypothetical protein